MILIKRLYWKYLSRKEAIDKKNWQRVNNPERLNRPVFLSGCYRSGTTIVSKTLARSPEVDFYSDGNHKAFNKYYLRDFYTIHKLIEHSYSQILLFQTNNEFYHLCYLLDQYPGAKAIIVFRHYADIVNSTLRNEWKWVKGQVVFNLKLFRLLFQDGRYEQLFDYLDDNGPSQLRLDPGTWTKFTNPSPVLDGLSGESVCYAVHWLLSARLAIDNNMVNDERVILVSYEKMVNTPSLFEKDMRVLGITLL